MHSQWEDFDLRKAQQSLKTAETGRHRKPNLVQTYARDMAAGRWRPSPQGLIFDTDGKLRDGGHRLEAFCLAARAVPDLMIRFWVTRGADPRSFEVLDTGSTRSSANLLEIHRPGIKYAKDVAAISRRAIMLLQGHPIGRVYYPSRTEIFDFADQHHGLTVVAERIHSYRSIGALSPGASGLVYWVLGCIDLEAATEFMEKVRTPAMLEEGSAVLALRNKLLGDPGRSYSSVKYLRGQYGARTAETAVAYSFIAWSRWRGSVAVKSLRLPTDALTDKSFPLPLGITSWKDVKLQTDAGFQGVLDARAS